MDFDNNIPIYIQLVDKLKVYIISDKIKNDYAKELSDKYFSGMNDIGFSKNDTIEYLKDLGGE